MPALTLKDELTSLENRKVELEMDIEQAPAPMPRLHPNLSELYGDLAGMLALANNSPTSGNEGLQVTMVAGARNRRYLHLDYAPLHKAALPFPSLSDVSAYGTN